ncbi:universal stress protein [Isoptericola sp. 4D.3]|uniref:Universal stress protein n=1 Tax=Isoptericola peretonis TaxID=2918523 RepID=A0ABT0J2T2_9MICO|nr:universal stress protein [Isoptericola sp. 4D.3]
MSERTAAPVVVGYDASEAADVALAWAAREARARGAVLRVVYVRDAHDTDVAVRPHGESLGERGDGGAWPVVEEAAARARDVAPGVETETFVEYASPAAALVGVSRDAGALVLGATRHGGLYEAVRGTVVLQVTAHALCPVVVVPAGGPRADLPPDAPVVVGYDGSEQSGLALDAATDSAWLLGRTLRVVVVWRPGVAEWVASRGPTEHEAHDLTEADAGPVLERALDRVEERLRGHGVAEGSLEVVGEVHEGQVVRVLHHEAEGAERLLLGTRGRGGFASLLLGSATHTLVRTSACPVVVVRAAQAASSA